MIAGNEGRSSGFCAQHSRMRDARGSGVPGGISKRSPAPNCQRARGMKEVTEVSPRYLEKPREGRSEEAAHPHRAPSALIPVRCGEW